MNDSERRDFSRVPVGFDVTVVCENKVVVSDCSKDVSMNGLFVVTDERLPSGTNCRITIHLDATGGSHQIAATGRVTRVTDHGFAVEFSEIPVDDYNHLRNLVLYNSEEIDQIEAELDSHLGLKRKNH